MRSREVRDTLRSLDTIAASVYKFDTELSSDIRDVIRKHNENANPITEMVWDAYKDIIDSAYEGEMGDRGAWKTLKAIHDTLKATGSDETWQDAVEMCKKDKDWSIARYVFDGLQ